MQNIIVQALRSLIIDLVGEILYFPIWWYSQGLLKILAYFVNSIKSTNRNLALSLLLRNFFRPMFGVQDRSGRIISLFMRLILILGRLLVFILLLAFYTLAVIFWLVLPLVVAAGLYYNFKVLWQR